MLSKNFKKRGVKVKVKLKTIEFISISMVVGLTAYLIHLNVSIGNFQATRSYNSTANYMQIPSSEDIATNILEETKKEDIEENDIIEENSNEIVSQDIKEEVVEVVYDGKTLDEISGILNKSLNSTISDKGYLIASHSIELGVDPYMATAIILQETGCKWDCSYLVKSCNNVGGQKGQGCGSYSYFNSLDEGIIAFIDNLYNNYISYGLTTPEQINPKYAEDQSWAYYVNNYIETIKAQ